MAIMLKKIVLFLFIILLSYPGGLFAYDLASRVTEFRLDNGMKWILVRRTNAPVFSGVVMVRVGGADEEKGKTGLAHMFEHMAFKGSSRIGTKDWQKEEPILAEIEKTGKELTKEQNGLSPDKQKVESLSKKLADLQKEADKFQAKNEIWEVLSRNGAADLNAYTSKDLTAYFASLPARNLKLWAKVTANMILDPAYREFYIERSVIAEERRAGTENNPDGAMSEKLLATAFIDGPYQWSTIGFEKDILGLTIGDAKAFHDRNYVPSNMVGALVGDFDVEEAKGIIRDSFGGAKEKPRPENPKVNVEDERGGIDEALSFRAEPSLAMAWHKPTLPDPAEYSFDIINSLLCDGSSSRLQKKLVYEKKLAESVYCTVSYPGSRLKNLFLIWVEPMKPYRPAEIEKEIFTEMARLSREPLNEKELNRVRKRVTAGLVYALEQNMGLAQQLAEFETVFGNWRLLAEYPKRISEISAKEVMETAQKYLGEQKRVVVERVKTR